MSYNILSTKSEENLYENKNHESEYTSTNYCSSEADSETEMEILDIEKQTVNQNANLKDRLKSLQITMRNLKEQLAEEQSKWKEEIEETKKLATLSNKMNTLSVREDVGAANEQIKDYSFAEYEEKLSTYQRGIINAQAEKRANFRRQMAINNYKRRLLEVENMCNLELLRVKQSVQYLQPLQMIASEWHTETMTTDEEISGVIDTAKKSSEELKQKDMNLLESLSTKLSGEFSDIFAKLNSSNLGYPHLSSSSSSLWPDEEDIVTTQSAVWYSSDNFSSCYNPLM